MICAQYRLDLEFDYVPQYKLRRELISYGDMYLFIFYDLQMLYFLIFNYILLGTFFFLGVNSVEYVAFMFSVYVKIRPFVSFFNPNISLLNRGKNFELWHWVWKKTFWRSKFCFVRLILQQQELFTFVFIHDRYSFALM